MTTTESFSNYNYLEKKTTSELLQIINKEDKTVPLIIENSLKEISDLIDKVFERMIRFHNEKKRLDIGVHDLIDAGPPKGDLYMQVAWSSKKRLKEGQRIHTEYQNTALEEDASFQREVKITHRILVRNWEVVISGRIDGLRREGETLIVEEIKSRRTELDDRLCELRNTSSLGGSLQTAKRQDQLRSILRVSELAKPVDLHASIVSGKRRFDLYDKAREAEVAVISFPTGPMLKLSLRKRKDCLKHFEFAEQPDQPVFLQRCARGLSHQIAKALQCLLPCFSCRATVNQQVNDLL